MTIYSWRPQVMQSGKLLIAPDKSFTGSGWATVLDKGIATINGILKLKGVGLVFEKADAGAQITISTYVSNKLHGNAELSLDSRDRLRSVLIRLPATPRVRPDDKALAVAPSVKHWIMVHELIHCIGPDNCEHTEGDVFVGLSVLSVGASVNGKVQAADGSDSLPPLEISAATVTKIKKAWPTAAPPTAPTASP